MKTQQEADYQTIKYEIARLDRQIIFNLAQRLRYKELAQKINPDNNNKLSQYLIDYYLSERRIT